MTTAQHIPTALPTDTELLDWLERKGTINLQLPGQYKRWLCRCSGSGRHWRCVLTTRVYYDRDACATPREAIAAVMGRENG